MAEHAGRERARLVVAVGARRKPTDADHRIIAEGRGHIDLGWTAISVLRSWSDLPANLVAAVDAVEKHYFGTYGQLRKTVLAAGEAGDCPLDGKQYFEQVTLGISTILKLAQEMSAAAERAAVQDASDSTSRTVAAAAFLLVGLFLAGLSYWVAVARVVRPITGMTAAMARLAGGDRAIVIAGAERNDEVGAMAKAVLVFKDNAIGMATLQAAQEQLKRQAEVEKRQALKALTDAR